MCLLVTAAELISADRELQSRTTPSKGTDMSTFAEFLHAFIENNAAAKTTPLPFMGPSGAQVWTAGIT